MHAFDRQTDRQNFNSKTVHSITRRHYSSELSRLSLSHQHLFHYSWINWTLFCTALRLSTQLAFNESSMQRLVLSCTSIVLHLQCLQVNFSNNYINFLSNVVCGLNLPPWPLKPCTLVVHHIFLTSCNTMNPRGLCAHPVLISFQSPSQFNIRISCFSVFRSESLEFITCQYPWIPVTSYFQTSSKDILFSVSLPPFSCPSYLEYLRPRALILLRPGAI